MGIYLVLNDKLNVRGFFDKKLVFSLYKAYTQKRLKGVLYPPHEFSVPIYLIFGGLN